MPSTVAAVTTFLKTVGLMVGGLGISGTTALYLGAATVVAGAVVAKKLIDNIYAVPNLDSDSSRQATVRGTVEPQKLIYGEALVSGPISFVGVAGDENRDLYHAIVLAGHQSTAITDIHFDDKVITNAQIAANGQVTGGTFGPQNSVTICTIRKLLGTQTQADSVLDNAFGTINTTEHIGTNLTYIVTKFTLTDDSQEIWDKYLPQNIKALVKGKKVYDPRQDSTSTYYDADLVGGVSTQRANDSSTWEWSENPVWCLVDYLTDDYFGMNIDLSRIDLAKAVDAADICDTLVDIPNSQEEKRFTCNGVVFGTATHKANINKLLSSMNGMLTYTNGKFVIRAGAFEAVASGMTLNDDNLIGPAKLKTSFERNERFNTITGTFIDPSNNYKEMEFPRVQITSALTRDNNEELRSELKLSMTNSFYMAQRIAHKLIQQSDLQKVLTFPTNLAGVNIAVGDRVSVTLSEFNYTNKTFVCLGWNLSESGAGGVNLILREDDSASYADMAVGSYSTVTPSGGIAEGFFGVPDPQNLSATALVEGIELDWTNPTNMTHIIAIEVFASTDSSWSNAVKVGETIGTQFIHDASNGVDSIADGDERYYWVRARRFPTGEGTDAVSDRNPDSDTSTVNATRGALGNLANQDTVGDGQIDDNTITSEMIIDGEVEGKTLALLLNQDASGNVNVGEGALVGVNVDGTVNMNSDGSVIYNGTNVTIEHDQYSNFTFLTQVAGKRGYIAFDINKTAPFDMGTRGDFNCAFVWSENDQFYYDANNTTGSGATETAFDPSNFTGSTTGTDSTNKAHIVALGALETGAVDTILSGGLYAEPIDISTTQIPDDVITGRTIVVNSITANKISGDISEVFSFGVQRTPLTLTSSEQTFAEFDIPAPDADLTKYASLNATMQYTSNSPTTAYAIEVDFERKSKGVTTGTSLGSVVGSGTTSSFFYYVEVSGNVMTQLDSFGGIASSATSPTDVEEVHAVEYIQSTDRTRIHYSDIAVRYTSGTIYYNPDRWTSSGAWLPYATSSRRYAIPQISSSNFLALTLHQPLAKSAEEESYRIRTRHAGFSGTSVSITSLNGQIELLT